MKNYNKEIEIIDLEIEELNRKLPNVYEYALMKTLLTPEKFASIENAFKPSYLRAEYINQQKEKLIKNKIIQQKRADKTP